MCVITGAWIRGCSVITGAWIRRGCVCSVITGAWIIFVPIGIYLYRGRLGKKLSPHRDYLG